jgi:Pup-ligase protein
MTLVGKIDWVAKKWLLQTFAESERLSWDHPWLQSLDLEYHNLDPKRGLYFGLQEEGIAPRLVTEERIIECMRKAPENTRARGRGAAVARLIEQDTSYTSIGTQSPWRAASRWSWATHSTAIWKKSSDCWTARAIAHASHWRDLNRTASTSPWTLAPGRPRCLQTPGSPTDTRVASPACSR